jgi:hypothetical protein
MKHYLKSFYRYYIRGEWQHQKDKKALASNQKPVLIYSMGKVGSLSLYHSIQAQTNTPAFHVHSLKQERIDWEYQACREKGWWPDSRNPGALIYEKKIQNNQAVSVVTTIREPIERNVSAFFEVFRYYNKTEAVDYKGDTSFLQAQFLKLVPHDYPLTWLEDELKMMLNIDVYATPFDVQKKYQKYQHKNLDLLLIRVDLSDLEKEQQLNEFLGVSKLKLVRHNVGAEKEYANLYQEFKTNLELPQSYVEQMLESKYCSHFYSLEERQRLFEKWTN